MKNVSNGSIVDVDYEGRTEDGKLFDTSKADVAKKEETFQEQRNYEPLHITVGKGS